jgi:hypothetical protein
MEVPQPRMSGLGLLSDRPLRRRYTHLSGSGKFVSSVNDRVFDFERNDAVFHARGVFQR